MRCWVVDATDVEAVSQTVDGLLYGAEDIE